MQLRYLEASFTPTIIVFVFNALWIRETASVNFLDRQFDKRKLGLIRLRAHLEYLPHLASPGVGNGPLLAIDPLLTIPAAGLVRNIITNKQLAALTIALNRAVVPYFTSPRVRSPKPRNRRPPPTGLSAPRHCFANPGPGLLTRVDIFYNLSLDSGSPDCNCLYFRGLDRGHVTCLEGS